MAKTYEKRKLMVTKIHCIFAGVNRPIGIASKKTTEKKENDNNDNNFGEKYFYNLFFLFVCFFCARARAWSNWLLWWHVTRLTSYKNDRYLICILIFLHYTFLVVVVVVVVSAHMRKRNDDNSNNSFVAVWDVIFIGVSFHIFWVNLRAREKYQDQSTLLLMCWYLYVLLTSCSWEIGIDYSSLYY